MSVVEARGVVEIDDIVDGDSEAIFEILGEVFGEYEGCVLERTELPEIVRPATSFAALGGRFWGARRGGVLLGFVAMSPCHEREGWIELKKLYLRREARGLGLGRRLVELVEREAMARGAHGVHLWTDTRFATAHRVYERLGYVRLPETRELHDVSESVEFHYEKQITCRQG